MTVKWKFGSLVFVSLQTQMLITVVFSDLNFC